METLINPSGIYQSHLFPTRPYQLHPCRRVSLRARARKVEI